MARKFNGTSERLRIPQPVLRHRIASGRGAMEQPNVTGDGDAALTLKFWCAVVVTGIAAGLFGIVLMALLFNVQYLAFDYHFGDVQSAVEHVSGLRRVAPLLIAGVFGGIAWAVLRHFTEGESSEIDDAIWRDHGKLSFRRSFGTSVISEIVIGMGASIGREAAPKLMGGVSASFCSRWFGLTSPQRRLLIACGGGAGLAAVYNVPLGGALFAAEILMGSVALPVVLPALSCSFIATSVAWLYLPNRATYVDIPNYHFSVTLLVWAILAAPIIGLAATAYIRMIGWVSHHRAKGRLALIAPFGAFSVLAVIGLKYPQLFGNGKGMAHAVFLGSGGLSLVFALAMLKPLLTALCLASGATGGLFTPFLSTGALLGAFLGLVWNLAWPGNPVGAFAMIGAAAMIGSAMQAPLVGLALVLELTHNGFQLMVPMIAATVIATALSRHLDGYSMYTARLPASNGATGLPEGD